MQVSHVDDHVTHAVVGGRKTIDFDISNSAEFFHILSSTLYTDQRLAVIREVVCNAWDAHIASGRTNLPVEITLKDNQIMIRDFGYGIADEDMGHIYGTYGNSTKQNDGKQTGGFGLGCKAPFAYTEHFQVVSHHKGVKTIYALSKSSAVVGGKPGITPIVSTPTEDTGLSVSIGVKSSSDAQYFIEKLKNLVYFGDIFVTFNGNVLPRIGFEASEENFFIFNNRLHGGSIHIRYGNVIYPFNSCVELAGLVSEVSKFVWNASNTHKNYGLILQAPPHSISVTPSRESLSMQANTVETLRTLFENFIATFKKVDPLPIQMKILKECFTKPGIKTKLSHALDRKATTTFFQTETKDSLRTIEDTIESRMQSHYPQEKEFRFLEIKSRLELLVTEGKIKKELVAPFLAEYKKELEKPNTFPLIFERHFYGKPDGYNHWFYNVYAKKIIRTLEGAGLSFNRLYVSDDRQIRYADSKVDYLQPFKSVRFACMNDCLPYLRNVVVLNTARNSMKAHTLSSDGKNHVSNGSGFLFYHVGKKKGEEEQALAYWQSLGMTVINLCHTASLAAIAEPKPKKPKIDGYPLLKNVWQNEMIDLKRLKNEKIKLDYSTTPEFFVHARVNEDFRRYIPGFHQVEALFFKYFGDRGVIVTTQPGVDVMERKKVPQFFEFLAEQVYKHISGNAAIFKNAATDHARIKDQFWGARRSSVEYILLNQDLVKFFDVEHQALSEVDHDFLKMLYHIHLRQDLSEQNSKRVSGLVEALAKVKLSPEVETFIKEVKENPVVDFMDLSYFNVRFANAKNQQEKDLLLDLFKTMFYL